MLCSKSQTLMQPAPEDAAKLLPDRWKDRDVYGPPSCHDARGVESLGELKGSHNLMPSVPHDKSLLSLVNVNPLTMLLLRRGG